MPKSRNRMVADWFSKIRQNETTGEVEHQDVATVETDVNNTINNLEGVPAGVIVTWSGLASAIPSGWNLCDGTNGTPNLVGKFIKAGSTAGTTGGSSSHSHSHTLSAGSHTLSTSQMPSHTHRSIGTNQPPSTSQLDAIVNPGSWNAWVTDRDSGTGDNRLGKPKSHGSEGGGSAHSHSLSGSIASGSNEPPYYELCYIMKT